MAVGWAPNRLKADPNGSGVNRLDTDDILAPHTHSLRGATVRIRARHKLRPVGDLEPAKLLHEVQTSASLPT